MIAMLRDASFMLETAVLAAALALLAAGSRIRRLTALALASAALGLPFWLPIHTPVLRALVGGALALFYFRMIDLVRERRALGPGSRLWLALAFFDTRRAKKTAARMDFLALTRHLAGTLVALVALYIATQIAPHLNGHHAQLVRWLSGAVFVYAGVEALAASVFALYRPLGILPPQLHDNPIFSRSVQEFWSRRWNRTVSAWLDTHCFRPLARRRLPTLGLIAAFAVSGALHGYPIWAGLGLSPAVLITGFFLAQAPIVAVERTLTIARWPRVAQRLWTVGLLLLLSPLFVEPVLQLFETAFE
jgi:hypothetical protein